MQLKQTVELCKHRAHASLLLAEKLNWGQSVINKRSPFKYRDLLHDHSNEKYREIFQAYNNYLKAWETGIQSPTASHQGC